MRTLRIAFLLPIALLLLSAGVSAYSINIDAPHSVQKGEPVIVNGTSNLPAGITVPIQFSRSEYTLEIIETKQVVIQGDKNFTVSFDTTKLRGGQYKLEILQIGNYNFLSGSNTLRVVQILDRSDEITFTSSQTQYLAAKTLQIAGSGEKFGGRGIQLTVDGPSGRVFGPEFISTGQTGAFSKNVPITKVGVYNVSFTDSVGFVGKYVFTVLEADSNPVEITPIITSVTQTPTPPAGSVLTASGTASRDAPAYFAITPKDGALKFYTSTSNEIDWVVEYLDSSGGQGKVNQKGKASPEEVTLPAHGGMVYVMVYPSTYSDKGDVTLYAENAVDLRIANNPPAGFVPGSTTVPTTPAKSPGPLLAVIGALGILFFVKKDRK
jgi:hypothetical protein